jgi:hypothetical protein
MVVGGRRLVELRAAGHEPGIPFLDFALLLQGVVGCVEPGPGVLRAPGAVNGIGDCVAEACVDFVCGRFREQPECGIDVIQGGIAGGKVVEDRRQDSLVVGVLLRGFLGGAQVFFKARLE